MLLIKKEKRNDQFYYFVINYRYHLEIKNNYLTFLSTHRSNQEMVMEEKEEEGQNRDSSKLPVYSYKNH